MPEQKKKVEKSCAFVCFSVISVISISAFCNRRLSRQKKRVKNVVPFCSFLFLCVLLRSFLFQVLQGSLRPRHLDKLGLTQSRLSAERRLL
jgi:hypothetical protein